MKNGSLPIRLSFWICSILILSFLLTVTVLSIFWYRNLSRGLNEHGLSMVRETAYNLDRIFLQTEMSTELLAADLETDVKDKKEIAPFLKIMAHSIIDQCPEVTGVSIVFAERMLHPDEKWNAFICSHAGDACKVKIWNTGRVDYFRKEWFRIPMKLLKPVWTVPYASDSHSGTVLSYSAPFYSNRNGKRVAAGVVVADIPVRPLEKYFQDKVIGGSSRLAASCAFFLINNAGRVMIAAQNLDASEDDVSDPEDRERVNAMHRSPFGKIRLDKTPFYESGACELFYASCVNKWIVCLAIPGDWMARLLLPVFLRFLVIGILAMVVIVFTIFTVCKRLSRPLLELSHAAEALGNGDFSMPLPEACGSDEVKLMSNSFQRMRSDLTGYIAKLKDTVVARERAEGELNAAKSIQRDLLPPELPPDKAYPEVFCAGDLIPARGVGGDLYDVFPVDPDHLAVIVGDVSGKGVPAALFMAVAQTLQRTLGRMGRQPDALVTKLNALLALNNTSNMFVTYWLGVLNVRTGEMDYTNGGHNPPVLMRADGTQIFLQERHGPPLAIVPQKSYGRTRIQMEPGDVLLLYTDGVTEAFNAAGVMFGEDGLWKTLANPESREPGDVVKAVRDAVFVHADGEEQSDDITLLAVRFRSPEPTVPDRIVLNAELSKLNAALEFITGGPEGAKFPPEERRKIQICAEEIFVNIASYAYGPDSGKVEIRRCFDPGSGEYRVTFADSGRPCNPLDRKDPDVTLPVEKRRVGGLGIYIVKQQMDFVDYRYVNGKNEFTIGKRIPGFQP